MTTVMEIKTAVHDAVRELTARRPPLRPPMPRRKQFVVTSHAPGDSPAMTITTVDVDRVGDRVFPEGLDLRAFQRNPVLLWAHDHVGRTASGGIPIGSIHTLEVQPGRGIHAAWRWLENDPFASRVKNAWNQGVIRAASIGFIPLEATPNRTDGFDITKAELLEVSLVPVPANPAAVRTLKTLGLVSEPALVAHAVREALTEIYATTARRPA